jgi:calcineurin-like phosphoesterase family protein
LSLETDRPEKDYHELMEVFDRIKCRDSMHLVLGNHDKLDKGLYWDMGFETVETYNSVTRFEGRKPFHLKLIHDPAICTVDYGQYWACGHVHRLFKYLPESKVVNVGVDVWNYRPVELEEIKKLFT